MTTRISTLPSLATVTDATIIPVVEGGATKRITGLALKTYTGTAAGPQGPQGPAGSNGSAGSTGPTGPSGPSGAAGSGASAATPTVLGTVVGSTAAGNSGITSLGYNSAVSASGSYCVGVGTRSLGFTGPNTGSYNTAVGADSLYALTSGVGNAAFGYGSMGSHTTGNYNAAFGYDCLSRNTTAADNAAFGAEALRLNTTGTGNTAIGRYALTNNTTGNNSVAVGYQAMYANTAGLYNTAVGYQALYSQDSYGGESNTAIGWRALYSAKGGVGGIAQGNTAVGSQAGNYLTGVGNNNSTLIGAYAGYSATSGSDNTLIGNNSGYYITSGSKNTVLGRYNGNQGGLDIRTASNYIVMSDGDGNPRGMFNSNGYFAASPSGGFPDGTNLPYHYFSSPSYANGAQDQVLYVRADSASYAGNVIGIRGNRNTTDSTFNLLAANNGNDSGRFAVRDSGNCVNTNNSYGSISDISLKENIVDATPKLADLMQVQVRNYNLKIKPEEKHIGVIAQELEQVFPGLVEIDNEGIKNVKYSVFVPMLIKAIQELKTEFDAYRTAHP
jgi:hypothetical protein